MNSEFQNLNDNGVNDSDIRFVALVAAPEGIKRVNEIHSSVTIYVGALDRQLNEHAYIVLGLGDAGDHLYGANNFDYPIKYNQYKLERDIGNACHQ